MKVFVIGMSKEDPSIVALAEKYASKIDEMIHVATITDVPKGAVAILKRSSSFSSNDIINDLTQELQIIDDRRITSFDYRLIESIPLTPLIEDDRSYLNCYPPPKSKKKKRSSADFGSPFKFHR